jgi:uncharacterized protein YbjT (DUF2867 family)
MVLSIQCPASSPTSTILPTLFFLNTRSSSVLLKASFFLFVTTIPESMVSRLSSADPPDLLARVLFSRLSSGLTTSLWI